MVKLDVSVIKKHVHLQHCSPDFLTDVSVDMNGETEYYLPMLCFHLEDDCLTDFIPDNLEHGFLFTAWIRAYSYKKDSELIPKFMYIDYEDVETYEIESFDLDFPAEEAMMETIAEQCPDACGKTLMELLEECRTSLCNPLNEKIDKQEK